MKRQIPSWVGIMIILVAAVIGGLVIYENFLNTAQSLQSETFMTISAPVAITTTTAVAVPTNNATTPLATSSYPSKSLPAWVIVKAYNVTGPAQTNPDESIPITWTSVNTSNCYATGNWSGAKPPSGSATVISPTVTGISYADAKTYSYGLSCLNDTNGEVVSSTVQVLDVPELGQPVGPPP